MLTMRRVLCLPLLLLLGACAHAKPAPVLAPAPAPTPTPAAVQAPPPPVVTAPAPRDDKLPVDKAVERFLTAPELRTEWFAPSFLGAVPFASIQPIRDQTAAALGAFQHLDGKDSPFDAVYDKGHVTVNAKLDAEGRFVGLFLKPVAPAAKSMDELLDAFKKLPGKVSVLVLDGSATLGALEPDASLAVGSTFKLATLAALRAQIDAKKRSWSTVVELSPQTRSLPSGLLQEWPDGAPLTLYALAALMISRSDNTATDTLIGALGRGNIEPFAGRNKPYLMTREMFLLKSHGAEPLLARYRAGDEAARRAVLDELKGHALPKVKDYPSDPTAIDVEWYFSTRELCELMRKVADLPLMTINSGVADKAAWDRVAYKGGSEPGVLNTTSWLEKGKHAYCVSTTWNAPSVLDEKAFFAADERAFAYLATLP